MVLTFTRSMQASIFSCSTAFLAWEMLVVLLLGMPSFILRPLKRPRPKGCRGYCSKGEAQPCWALPFPPASLSSQSEW